MRSIVYLALIAACMAAACTGTIGKASFDLSPLKNDIEDYRTRLYSPDDNFNRTYVLMVFVDIVALCSTSAETP